MKTKPLIDLCLNEFSAKYGIPAKAEDYDETKTRYLRITDITDGGALRMDEKKSVSSDDLDKYLLSENEIVFARTGNSTGRAFFYETKYGDLAYAGFLIKFRLDQQKVNPKYLKYYTLSSYYREWVINCSLGSTRGNLNAQSYSQCPILLPPREAQDKLVDTLSLIDSKIELNNKINAELESLAKLIYDYWFVQFDFPDENGKPYKSSGGKMVYNEELKREIPEGWRNGELQDIANITMGQSPSGDSYNEARKGDVFYQGCTDFGLRFPTNRKFTTKPTRFAKRGDILLSVRAPVGTMNIANEDCCIGRGLAALNSKNGSITYLDGVLQRMKQIFDLRNASGTTFGSITKGDLFSIPVVIPDNATLQRFDAVTNLMFEKQNLIGLENQKLSELRDWLLPMLMNGQVTIKD